MLGGDVEQLGLGGLEVEPLAHDVQRPLLDLVVDAPDVLADDAHGDELDAADQQHGEQDRGHTLGEDAEVARDDDQGQARERGQRESEPEQHRQLQRHLAERGQCVEGELHHALQAVLRVPVVAGVALVSNRVLAEAHPHAHAAQEAVALAHRPQRVQRGAVHEPEVAALGG